MSMYEVRADTFAAVDPEMNTKAQHAINQCWQYIGADVLACDEVNSISRADMLETCLDASRLEDFDKEAAKYVIWFERFHKTEYNKWIKSAFPYSRYGY